MGNILIVDDSRTSRRILKSVLENQGHQVVGEAKNGEEGYQMFKELKPDIVTLDVTMPVLDGIGALKKIKGEFPEAKCVMVTAAGQKTKLVEAVQAGADEFIPKPFDTDNLGQLIKDVLAK
ncbi:MAG: response regulator [Lachnospiraceae bacterium]|nr:response regulator [Lachnospiraceae bacterium]